MHEVLVNRLGGLSLPRKSVVRLIDRPAMTLDVYRGRKTTIQPTRKSVVRLTDRPDMTLDVYRGRKTTMQHATQLDQLVLLHLIHINVDYLTMPLFSHRRSKL